jgi:UrcA family protein
MNAIKVSMSAALVLSVMAITPTFAADPTAPRAVTVYYDELNMNSQSGATVLYSRLRAASRHVCATFAGRDLRQHAAFNDCYNTALSAAVARVNRSTVTALHMRVTKGVKAS